MAASGFNSAPVRTASELATGGDQRPAVLRQGMQPAPYQPQAPSPLEMFGGQQPPADDPTAEMTAKRFLVDLRAAYPDRASAILNSPAAVGIYQYYIRNGYRLPAT